MHRTAVRSHRPAVLGTLMVLILLAAGWFWDGTLATRRQREALGYAGPPGAFHSDFLARRVHTGMHPDDVYRALHPGARVKYYVDGAGDASAIVVQWFDYTLLGAGPYIAVLYRGNGPGQPPVVVDVYTDSYGPSGARRVTDQEAYGILRWSPEDTPP
jgi:hypothetical protein